MGTTTRLKYFDLFFRKRLLSTMGGYTEWPKLIDCIKKYGKNLSLPDGITEPIDILPDETMHRLLLQNSFDLLNGLGQDDELTLENEDQKEWRINGFIDSLKEIKDTIEYFNLSIEKLFKLLKLPQKDEKILINSMLKKLGLKSISEELYYVLQNTSNQKEGRGNGI